MTDSLAWRCDQKLTLREAPDSRDVFTCGRRAEFWVYQIGHVSQGSASCAQHLSKALRAALAKSGDFLVVVGEISRMDIGGATSSATTDPCNDEKDPR